MGDPAVDYLVRALGETVRRLAADPAEQIAYLHSEERAVPVDELGIEFHEAFIALVWRMRDAGIPEAVAQGIRTLDQALEVLSPDLWDEAALASAPEWRSIRTLAAPLAPVLRDIGLECLLLTEGLEDLIALPEVALTAVSQGLLAGTDDDSTLVLAQALTALVRVGKVQVWTGHWDGEPRLVPAADAEELLRVPARYRFCSPEDLDIRVYYVNVENLWVDPESEEA